MSLTEEKLDQVVRAFKDADGLLITAGAGFGVDSGLPDFRGSEGFWKAYPALAKSKLQFQDIASPGAFQRNPRQAWGFYGHRLNLYRATEPHEGFSILLRLADKLEHQYCVFTSNVDGQFQKAGFDHRYITEVHGSIHHLQCFNVCSKKIWSANDFSPVVDEEICELVSDLPHCPKCGALARPNILMFGDWNWQRERTSEQSLRLHEWTQQARNPVIIELGAGKDIQTVRTYSERSRGKLIRINPRDEQTPEGGISIRAGALEALREIEKRLI